MGTDNMRTIREMTFDDIDPVMEIERACFTTPWTAEGFLSFMLREGTVFLVAEEDGEILGQCGFVSAADEADITNVAVAPRARRRGIAKMLVEQLLTEAGRRGIRSIFLEVRKSNEAAIRLYEGQGFEAVGERKNYYEDPVEDALLMCRVDESGDLSS